MTTTKKAPEVEPQSANFDLFQKGISIKIECKDTNIFSESSIRQRIFGLFLSGGKYSVVQLVLIFQIPDPRSHILYIRNAGIPISDYWVVTKYSRYKVYFLAKIGG